MGYDNNNLYCCFNFVGMVCSNVVIYDFFINKWIKGVNMNILWSWVVVVVVGDKLYVVGG